MRHSLLTTLRNKNTKLSEYRKATKKLCQLIASDASSFVKEKNVTIQTPLQKTTGKKIEDRIVLVPILRSAMAMLPSFMEVFEEAKIGFIGIRRDEKTALAHLYYENLPNIDPQDKIFILDPMIATGGSTTLAIQKLIAANASASNIFVINIISAKQGIQAIKKTYEKVSIYSVASDSTLNKKKFIVPGLGDFGDRFFGT